MTNNTHSRKPRSYTIVAMALIVAVVSATTADAQDAWWNDLTGYGGRPYESDNRQRRESAASSKRQQAPLNDLRPNDIPWRSDEMLIALEQAINTYKGIVSRGGWKPIPGRRMMRPGDDDERVPFLRARLRATGEFVGRKSAFESLSFGARLEAAVVRFQEKNGLRPSGRVDRTTLAALNVTAEQRLHQLKLNHQRILELLRQSLEERYVLVNVPAYQLEAVERYKTVLRHRVIVGRPDRETPNLRATIKAVNFFPYWKVPNSVAKLDLIPRLMKEPDYLFKEKIRVVSGNYNGPEIDPANVDWRFVDTDVVKFKQDPGPQNALGLVRIDMQNEHGVYMHDTPLKKLFGQRTRPFSAGCVRVQDVFELIEWIVRLEPGWGGHERVEAALAAGQALTVDLTRPLPVYFTYVTAWADQSGRIHFRPDIYNRDGAPVQAADFQDPDAPALNTGLAP